MNPDFKVSVSEPLFSFSEIQNIVQSVDIGSGSASNELLFDAAVDGVGAVNTGKYATITAALAAGKTRINVAANCTENANITLTTECLLHINPGVIVTTANSSTSIFITCTNMNILGGGSIVATGPFASATTLNVTNVDVTTNSWVDEEANPLFRTTGKLVASNMTVTGNFGIGTTLSDLVLYNITSTGGALNNMEIISDTCCATCIHAVNLTLLPPTTSGTFDNFTITGTCVVGRFLTTTLPISNITISNSTADSLVGYGISDNVNIHDNIINTFQLNNDIVADVKNLHITNNEFLADAAPVTLNFNQDINYSVITGNKCTNLAISALQLNNSIVSNNTCLTTLVITAIGGSTANVITSNKCTTLTVSSILAGFLASNIISNNTCAALTCTAIQLDANIISNNKCSTLTVTSTVGGGNTNEIQGNFVFGAIVVSATSGNINGNIICKNISTTSQLSLISTSGNITLNIINDNSIKTNIVLTTAGATNDIKNNAISNNIAVDIVATLSGGAVQTNNILAVNRITGGPTGWGGGGTTLVSNLVAAF